MAKNTTTRTVTASGAVVETVRSPERGVISIKVVKQPSTSTPSTAVSKPVARSGGSGASSPPKKVSGTGVVGGRYYVKGREVSAKEYYNRPEYREYVEGRTATKEHIAEYSKYSTKDYKLRVGGAVFVSKDPRFGTQGVARTMSGEAYDKATGQYLPGTGAIGGEVRHVDGRTIDYRKQKTSYAVLDGRLVRDPVHAGKVMETRTISKSMVFGNPPPVRVAERKSLVSAPRGASVQGGEFKSVSFPSRGAAEFSAKQIPGGKVFYAGQEIPVGFVPVTEVRGVKQITERRKTGEEVYEITPSRYSNIKDGKVVKTEFPGEGKVFNVSAFVEEYAAKGWEIQEVPHGARVIKPIYTTNYTSIPGAAPGFVVARPASEGEKWVNIGKKRMADVKDYPIIKELEGARGYIAKGSQKQFEKFKNVTKSREGKPLYLGAVAMETAAGAGTAGVEGGASVLGLPRAAATVTVGAGTMAQQAVVSPESFVKTSQAVAVKAAPIVGAAAVAAGTGAIATIQQDPRTLLYAGAYVAGAYVTTSAAISGAAHIAKAGRGYVETLGYSHVRILSKQPVKGGEVVGAEFMGRGMAKAPGGLGRVDYTIKGTSEGFAGKSGFTAGSSKGVMDVSYKSILGGKKHFTIPYTEAVASAGVKQTAPIVSPSGVSPGFGLGVADDLAQYVTPRGVFGGGRHYVSIAKGAKDVPAGVAVPYAKGAVSRELLQSGTDAVYFSVGREVTRAGAKSTISEFTLVSDVSKVPLISPAAGGGGGITIAGGGGGTISAEALKGSAVQFGAQAGLKAQETAAGIVIKETVKDVGTISTAAGTPAQFVAGGLEQQFQQPRTAPPSSITITTPQQVPPRGVGVSKEIAIPQVKDVTRAKNILISPSVSISEVQLQRGVSKGVVSTSIPVTKQVPSTKERVDVMTTPGVMPFTSSDSGTATQTITRTDLVPLPPGLISVTSPSPTPTPSITEIIPPFSPSLDTGGAVRGARFAFPGSAKKGYAPSIAAIGLGITGKKPKGTLTGLEFRPIPSKKKRRRRKK